MTPEGARRGLLLLLLLHYCGWESRSNNKNHSLLWQIKRECDIGCAALDHAGHANLKEIQRMEFLYKGYS